MSERQHTPPSDERSSPAHIPRLNDALLAPLDAAPATSLEALLSRTVSTRGQKTLFLNSPSELKLLYQPLFMSYLSTYLLSPRNSFKIVEIGSSDLSLMKEFFRVHCKGFKVNFESGPESAEGLVRGIETKNEFKFNPEAFTNRQTFLPALSEALIKIADGLAGRQFSTSSARWAAIIDKMDDREEHHARKHGNQLGDREREAMTKGMAAELCLDTLLESLRKPISSADLQNQSISPVVKGYRRSIGWGGDHDHVCWTISGYRPEFVNDYNILFTQGNSGGKRRRVIEFDGALSVQFSDGERCVYFLDITSYEQGVKEKLDKAERFLSENIRGPQNLQVAFLTIVVSQAVPMNASSGPPVVHVPMLNGVEKIRQQIRQIRSNRVLVS